MGFWRRLFKGKDTVPGKQVSRVGIVGHDVFAVVGEPTAFSVERRHQRNLKRMKLAADKLREFDKRKVRPDDPLYEEWAIEYQKRSLAVREYNLRHGRKG